MDEPGKHESDRHADEEGGDTEKQQQEEGDEQQQNKDDGAEEEDDHDNHQEGATAARASIGRGNAQGAAREDKDKHQEQASEVTASTGRGNDNDQDDAAANEEKAGDDDDGAIPAQQATTSGLGEEWQIAVDPSTGASYYYNSQTGETSWVYPSAASTTEGVQQQHQVQQEQQQQQYYHQQAASLSSHHDYHWPRLKPLVPGATPQLPPELEKLHRALDKVAPVEDLEIPPAAAIALSSSEAEAEAEGNESQADRAAGGGEEGGGGGGGGGNWVELMDETRGRPYYYHTGTFQTQWEMPPDFQGESRTTYKYPRPSALPDGVELTVFEDLGYQASLNKRTGRVSVRGPWGSDLSEMGGVYEGPILPGVGPAGGDHDRDLRQMGHYFDVQQLAKNREEAKRRKLQGKNLDWRAIREQQKVKKQKKQMEWLLND